MLFFFLAALTPAQIQNQILANRQLESVALSPDGARVAWVEQRVDKNRIENFSAVWVGAPNQKPERVTARSDDGDENSPAWLPDSKSLAFVSSDARGAVIYVWDGTKSKKLAAPGGRAQSLRFSADAKHLHFLGAAQSGFVGATEALPADKGELKDAEPEQRLGEIDLASGALRWITPPGYYVYSYDENATRFAFIGTHGSGLANYWVAELATCSVSKACQPETIWQPSLQLAEPRLSKDGAHLAIIHGLMSDEGSNGGDIEIIDLPSHNHRTLLTTEPLSVAHLHWRDDQTLVFSAIQQGESVLAEQALGDAHEHLLWRGGEEIHELAIAGQQSAVIRSTLQTPWHVDIGAIGSWKQASPVATVLDAFTSKKITWRNDVFQMSGWLASPKSLQTGKKYPLIVFVHGGPGGAETNGWSRRFVPLLASLGYFVFLPNPRGSFGGGEGFTEANRKEFGHGDLDDILKGVDAVKAAAPIDDHKIGLLGWSYGGFMAMFAPTQTHRFAAAVAGAGISNWESYWGENRINTWLLPFFGASLYDAPEVYRKSSAVAFMKTHKTPTLILAGERDGEVPPAQSYELWTALRYFKVPTTFVLYPGEGHHFRDENNLTDAAVRTAAWFDKYLR